MTQLCLFSEAILALKGLLNGSGLPQEHNHFTRPPQSHGVRVVPCCEGYVYAPHMCSCHQDCRLALQGRTTFNNGLPLSDPQNFKVSLCSLWGYEHLSLALSVGMIDSTYIPHSGVVPTPLTVGPTPSRAGLGVPTGQAAPSQPCLTVWPCACLPAGAGQGTPLHHTGTHHSWDAVGVGGQVRSHQWKHTESTQTM